MYQRALTDHEKIYGSEDEASLKLCTIDALALLLWKQGRLKEAEQMSQRALTGYEKKFGPTHWRTLMVSEELETLGHPSSRWTTRQGTDMFAWFPQSLQSLRKRSYPLSLEAISKSSPSPYPSRKLREHSPTNCSTAGSIITDDGPREPNARAYKYMQNYLAALDSGTQTTEKTVKLFLADSCRIETNKTRS